MVELQPSKLEVAGSRPVFRSGLCSWKAGREVYPDKRREDPSFDQDCAVGKRGIDECREDRSFAGYISEVEKYVWSFKV